MNKKLIALVLVFMCSMGVSFAAPNNVGRPDIRAVEKRKTPPPSAKPAPNRPHKHRPAPPPRQTYYYTTPLIKAERVFSITTPNSKFYVSDPYFVNYGPYPSNRAYSGKTKFVAFSI